MKGIACNLFAVVLLGQGIAFASMPQVRHTLTLKVAGKTHSFPIELIIGTPMPLAGKASGRRTFEPLVFRKRIDKMSAMLQKLHDDRTVIAQGTLEEFTLNSSGKWIFSRRSLMRGLTVKRIIVDPKNRNAVLIDLDLAAN